MSSLVCWLRGHVESEHYERVRSVGDLVVRYRCARCGRILRYVPMQPLEIRAARQGTHMHVAIGGTVTEVSLQ